MGSGAEDNGFKRFSGFKRFNGDGAAQNKKRRRFFNWMHENTLSTQDGKPVEPSEPIEPVEPPLPNPEPANLNPT